MEMHFIFAIAFIVCVASLVHGSIGFGFGMISTPLIALFTDIQTTIILMLIPTMVTNIISISNEGKFIEAVKRFWFIILLMIIGSVVGTLLLLYTNSEYYKLLLAFIIFMYLFQSYKNLKITFISKYPRISTYLLGIFGGIISGLTNIVAPLMIMYSMERNYSKKDTIQLSNLCFLFTKAGQLCIFLYFSAFTVQLFEVSVVGVISVLVGLFIGLKIKRKIDAELYTKILKFLLFTIASMLVFTTI